MVGKKRQAQTLALYTCFKIDASCEQLRREYISNHAITFPIDVPEAMPETVAEM
jgi:hypothetical protein